MIFYDIACVVATVNFINIGKTFIENSAAAITKFPGTNFIDDIMQGVGAGLLTSVAGHTAKLRCRGYYRWHPEEAKLEIKNHLGSYVRLSSSKLNIRTFLFR